MRQIFTTGSRVATLAAGGSRLVDLWCTFINELFDPYRPELHYMRGPGPKWRERHHIPEGR